MAVDFDSCRADRMPDGARKTDSLQRPIEIVGIRVMTDIEAEIVGSTSGRRHQLACDLGKMAHRFIHRVKDFYVQLARPSLIRLLAHRREHHIGSRRNQFFGARGWVDDHLWSSPMPSLSCAFAAHTLGRFRRLRDVCRAFALRGRVMETTPSSNCEALCALARILARQAVREHFNRASPSSHGDVNTNPHQSLLAASLNA